MEVNYAYKGSTAVVDRGDMPPARFAIASMPKKIRELKSLLLKAGFTCRPGKGSHSKWIHPKLAKSIIIAGKDGSDAKTYLEKQVNEALEALKEMEAEDTEE